MKIKQRNLSKSKGNPMAEQPGEGAPPFTKSEGKTNNFLSHAGGSAPLSVETEPPCTSTLFNNRVEIGLDQSWSTAKDRDYFESIWGEDLDEGEDPFAFVVTKIQENQDQLNCTLDEAALYWSDNTFDSEILHLLSIAEKVALLRKLVVEQIVRVPVAHQRNYLFRFNEHLEMIEQVQALHRIVILKYLVHPAAVWLSELVHLADWIITGQFEFEEGMECEHQEFQSWRKGRTS